MTDINYNNLVENYIFYFNKSKNIGESFGGPSLYFHNRALFEMKNNFLGETHIAMIYATLASWGMHRMGETKTKLADFQAFKESILLNEKELRYLQNIKIESIKPTEKDNIIKDINKICFSFQVSISDSKIVGNSKTLAHILPSLVPPIDRQYTIRFFQAIDIGKSVRDFKDIPDEKKYFDFILGKTFDFVNLIQKDSTIEITNGFHTSYPKIFDNLIMAYIKEHIRK